jgi:hypothetical protein
VAHRIRENRAQQPDRSTSGAFATAHMCESPGLRFGFAGRFPRGNIEHERFNIGPRDAGDRASPEQGLYVPLDTPAVRCKRAHLLRRPPPRHQSASFGVG